jgi:hypothetical protein
MNSKLAALIALVAIVASLWLLSMDAHKIAFAAVFYPIQALYDAFGLPVGD